MRIIPQQSLLLLSILTFLLIIAITECRRGSGGSGRSSSGRSSSSRSSSSRSSSSRSSWGSSSRSGSSYGSRSSSSRSSGSRWGSSSRSGSSSSSGSSSRYGSSGGSGGSSSGNWFTNLFSRKSPSSSATRYGSSASSGSSGLYGSFSSGSAGVARPNYGLAGLSALRSSSNRPSVRTPIPSRTTVIHPIYSTRYTPVNNYVVVGGVRPQTTVLLIGDQHHVGGYMFGHMLIRDRYRYGSCCYGCGCGYYGPTPPWYYTSYVPYRYRHTTYTSSNVTGNTTRPVIHTVTQVRNEPQTKVRDAGVETPKKDVQLCDLARWNMELPFSEMPNMILTFLANEYISGENLTEKAQFVNTFFNTTATSYGRLSSDGNVFTISNDTDLSICNFNIPNISLESANSNATLVTNMTITTEAPDEYYEYRRRQCSDYSNPSSYLPECDQYTRPRTSKTTTSTAAPEKSQVEEPFYTAVQQMMKLYSNQSSDIQMLSDLADAAKRCYSVDTESTNPPLAAQPCLDFSISPDQILSLDTTSSIFANSHVCKKLLSPDLLHCSLALKSVSNCSLMDLTNLNVFARNYYLCEEAVDSSLIAKLESQQSTTMNPGLLGINRNVIYASPDKNSASSGQQPSRILSSLMTLILMPMMFLKT